VTQIFEANTRVLTDMIDAQVQTLEDLHFIKVILKQKEARLRSNERSKSNQLAVPKGQGAHSQSQMFMYESSPAVRREASIT
jgi:hypothetical protein